ncbi:MAG: SCP2 sterol-binding domain-containing protein [Candidatus Bathyarchaeia archaeon]
MAKFGTFDWGKELVAAWDANTELKKLLKGLSVTIIIKISDKPELKPTFHRIENGALLEVRHAGVDERSEMVFEATIEKWKAILTGKLDIGKAVMQTRDLKMTGSLAKILQYTKGFIKMLDLWKSVTTEF